MKKVLKIKVEKMEEILGKEALKEPEDLQLLSALAKDVISIIGNKG
jgi:hypothetical protein